MKTAATHQVEDETAAIVGLYLLFARLLTEELSPELREILLQAEVLEILNRADPEVSGYLSGDWGAEDYEEAAVAFCDTFILPERSIQPRAAAWLNEGNLVSPDGIHAVVDTFVREKGIKLPSKYTDIPFDHGAVLFFVAATLRRIGSEQSAEFEEATLGSWVADFGAALSRSNSPLYRALGKLVEIV